MNELPETASPLYEKVKDYVLGRIGSGAWPRNQRLPSENELVTTLGVSRMTVHRALRELTEQGHLLRIQGVGTFVAPPKPQSTLIEVANIGPEIRARGHRHRSDVIVLEACLPSVEVIAAFEFGRRVQVFHSVVVHWENELPVQLEERFVNPELAPDYLAQDFTAITTYDYLTGATPLTEVEHVISAVPADAETARLLRMDVGASCLLLNRRTWSGVRVATVNRLTYVGSRYSLGSRYSPRNPG